MPLRFWVCAALCSVVPDLDVVTSAFGIPYGSVWGHRGFTHSLLFAVLVGCLIAALAFRRGGDDGAVLVWAAFFSLLTATHLALDSVTNGGLGVALWAPWEDTRYFFRWRPIRVSPIGMDFFGRIGMRALLSEIVWVWIPAGILAGAGWYRRKRAANRVG